MSHAETVIARCDHPDVGREYVQVTAFRSTCTACGQTSLVEAIPEDRRSCARNFGSDGRYCSTHNGRFASVRANRCDRRIEAAG